MANPFDEPNPFDAEGGAEGGAPDTAPSKAAGVSGGASTVPPTHEAPRDLERERQSVKDAMSSLTHGQGEPLDRQEDNSNRHVAGALGEGISVARGVPLVGSHIDELSALLQAHAASGPEYQKKLGEARGAVNQAVSNTPQGPLIGSLAFAPLLPETAPGRVALGTLSGASEGAGSAPNMSQAIKPALVGGAAGLGTSLIGEALTAGGGALGDKRAGVLEKNRAATDKAIDKSVRSATGTVGQKEAEAAQALRVLEERASSASGDPAVRARARELLDSEYANQLRDQIAVGYQRRWESLGPSINKARSEMTDVMAGATPEARASAAQARLDDPSALIRRAKEMGPKVVLPAVGAALAGPAGAGAGALTSAVLGRSATTVRNALADPYVASRVLGLGENALKGAGAVTSSMSPVSARALDDYLEQLHEKEKPWAGLQGEKK